MTISAQAIISWVGVALMAGMVVLATKKFRRTQGRVWQFHLAYVVVAGGLVWLCRLPSMANVNKVVFSSVGMAIAGLVFPLWESLRALCSPMTVDDMEWLSYWSASGGMYFLTAYLKDYHLVSDAVQLAWFQFLFFFLIWLYLPFTDGSTLIFDFITRPLLSPIIDPITAKCNNWISGLVSTIVNASHLWFLWAFFMVLPKDLKRFVTIAVGTVYPLLASVTAITTPQKTDDTFWLTYWSCYGLFFLIMDWAETWLGRIWGFYTIYLFTTVYLMLPMTQGAEKVFRYILVPLAGLQESLLLRDAVLLKKDLMSSFPPERQVALRQLIAYSFNTDTPDDEDDENNNGNHPMDERVEISTDNAKVVLDKFKMFATSPWNRKALSRRNINDNNTAGGGGGDGSGPTESTSLV